MDATTLPAFSPVPARRDAALKVLEEASELCEAAKGYAKVAGMDDFAPFEADARACMLDEFADVEQTLANFEAAFGVTYDEIAAALERCVERNMERGRY